MAINPPEDRFASITEDSYATAEHPTPASMGGGIRRPNYAGVSRAISRAGTTAHDQQDQRLSAGYQRWREGFTPRQIRKYASASATTSTTTVLALGSPQRGFIWAVRRINVGPIDYTAGSFPTGIFVIATLAAQPTQPGTVADSGGQVISTTTLYPAEGTWGRDELVVQADEHVRILVTGLTTGTIVTAALYAEETVAGGPEQYAI